MRGVRRICCLIFIGTVIGLNICGCANFYTIPANSIQIEKTVKVGVALYDTKDTFIYTVYEQIDNYVSREEELSKTDIVVTMVDAKNNQEIQNEQIQTFINEKYDVIIVNIVDRSQASTIIDKAKTANIPLVFFNREPVPQDMNMWEKMYYIGAKAAQSGEMQGEIIANAIENGLQIDKNKDGVIQYVMLEGEPGHQDAILRTYYSIKVLEEKGYKTENLACDTAMWQKNNGKQKMLEWLETWGNDIEVVIANNDDMALGAIEALKEKSYVQGIIPVVGVDGIHETIEAIKNGWMLGTVLNNADEQGRLIFGTAYKLATGSLPKVVQGDDYEDKYLWVTYEIINKENVK